tara:strand:- start:2159 stop:3091 length:933 start_codon:yes stop_codon:yes gene_type:complete
MSWKNLTELQVLDCVETILKEPLSALCLKRNSYINRVFEVELKKSKKRFIVKFYRPARWTKAMIQEEHDFLLYLKEHDLPVIAPIMFDQKTLFEYNSIYFTIFPKKGGRALSEFTKEQWLQIGRMLGRLHQLSKSKPAISRVRWTPEEASKSQLATILASQTVPHDYVNSLTRSVENFIIRSQPYFNQHDLFLLHGDCHLGNLIERPNEGLFLVDFDDMVIGPAIQDVWMLLPDNVDQCQQEIAWFLEGYTLFRDFSYSNFELIPILKIMRQIHFAAWCAIQANEAQFKHHFPQWGSIQYWNELIKDINI